MKNLQGKTVLITGGAAGIGKIMSRLMLERNASVIIWDINKEKIDETVAELSANGNIKGYKVDVSSVDEVNKTAAIVKKEHGTVDVLINNAGIVVGKFFHEHTEQDITRTMDINANAPMNIALAFLPDMMKQNSGHICNIASSAGLISNPKMAVYAASKWSVVGWSDSLRLEMKQLNKNIGVTTVMPYYINTGMFDGVKSRIPILEPEKVALQIIRGIEKNKIFLSTPGWIYRLVRTGQGLLPVNIYDWFAGKVLGIYNTMDEFKGH